MPQGVPAARLPSTLPQPGPLPSRAPSPFLCPPRSGLVAAVCLPESQGKGRVRWGWGVGRAAPGKPVGPVWQSWLGRALGLRVSQRPQAGETLGWKRWGALSRQEAQGTQEHRPASPQTKARGAPQGSVSVAGQPHPQPGQRSSCTPAPQVGGASCCPSQATGWSLSRPRICLQPQGSRPESVPGRAEVCPPRRAGRWQLGGGGGRRAQRGPGPRPPAGPVGWSVASEGLGRADGQSQGCSARPAGLEFESQDQGWDGVGVPAQGRTRLALHQQRSGCRVTSSGSSQPPSPSGQRGLWPVKSCALCQRLSQPPRGEPRPRVPINYPAWPGPRVAREAHRQSQGWGCGTVGTSQGAGRAQGSRLRGPTVVSRAPSGPPGSGLPAHEPGPLGASAGSRPCLGDGTERESPAPGGRAGHSRLRGSRALRPSPRPPTQGALWTRQGWPLRRT